MNRAERRRWQKNVRNELFGKTVLGGARLIIHVIRLDHWQRQAETFEPLEPLLQRDVQNEVRWLRPAVATTAVDLRPPGAQLKHQQLIAVLHRALISAIFKKIETLLDAVSPRCSKLNIFPAPFVNCRGCKPSHARGHRRRSSFRQSCKVAFLVSFHRHNAFIDSPLSFHFKRVATPWPHPGVSTKSRSLIRSWSRSCRLSANCLALPFSACAAGWDGPQAP
jgi:hypothetical protein